MIPEEPEVLDGSDMMVDYREVVLGSVRFLFVIDRFGFLSIETSFVLCVRSLLLSSSLDSMIDVLVEYGSFCLDDRKKSLIQRAVVCCCERSVWTTPWLRSAFVSLFALVLLPTVVRRTSIERVLLWTPR